MSGSGGAAAAPEWLEIGRILGAQGLKGEVRVQSLSDFPERFLEPGRRWLSDPGRPEPQPVELLAGRWIPGKNTYVLKLEGITNRTQAEQLRGCQLWVPASERPHLEPGEFHIPDLIGLAIVDATTTETLGVVRAVIPAGNDLLEVQGTDGRTFWVPFVEDIVPVVNLAQGWIGVSLPPGLVELGRPARPEQPTVGEDGEDTVQS
ncbi:MAG: ribosome maturation factor RimM [Gloeomargaritaceae cyanobacterium C42_A2020_066]|nr:ribosome maturation factor RimM [Gloeomargaritaceae cyanobacterium C42_A2020_066]